MPSFISLDYYAAAFCMVVPQEIKGDMYVALFYAYLLCLSPYFNQCVSKDLKTSSREVMKALLLDTLVIPYDAIFYPNTTCFQIISVFGQYQKLDRTKLKLDPH